MSREAGWCAVSLALGAALVCGCDPKASAAEATEDPPAEAEPATQAEAPQSAQGQAAHRPKPTSPAETAPRSKPSAEEEPATATEPVASKLPTNVAEVPSAQDWPRESAQPELELEAALAAVARPGAIIERGKCRGESRTLRVDGKRVGATEGCEEAYSTAVLQGPDLTAAVADDIEAIFAIPGLTCHVTTARLYASYEPAQKDLEPGGRLVCQAPSPIRDYWFTIVPDLEHHDGVLYPTAEAQELARSGTLLALAVHPKVRWSTPFQLNLRRADPAVVEAQILARDAAHRDRIIHAGMVRNATDIQAALPGFEVRRMVGDEYAMIREDTRVARVMGLHYGHVSHVVLEAPGITTRDGAQVGDGFDAIASIPDLECYGGSPASLTCSAEIDGDTHYFDFTSDPPPPPPDPYERIFGEDDLGSHDHGPARKLSRRKLERIASKAKLSRISVIASYPMKPRTK